MYLNSAHLLRSSGMQNSLRVSFFFFICCKLVISRRLGVSPLETTIIWPNSPSCKNKPCWRQMCQTKRHRYHSLFCKPVRFWRLMQKKCQNNIDSFKQSLSWNKSNTDSPDVPSKFLQCRHLLLFWAETNITVIYSQFTAEVSSPYQDSKLRLAFCFLMLSMLYFSS